MRSRQLLVSFLIGVASGTFVALMLLAMSGCEAHHSDGPRTVPESLAIAAPLK